VLPGAMRLLPGSRPSYTAICSAIDLKGLACSRWPEICQQTYVRKTDSMPPATPWPTIERVSIVCMRARFGRVSTSTDGSVSSTLQ
jgi:hypothetical protein